MEIWLTAAVAAGGGVVTMAQLSALGADPRAVARMVRAGELVRLRRGVFTSGEWWSGLDEFRGRPLLRIRAAERTLELGHVYSHDSSGVLHGLPLLDARRSDVHVTRPGVLGSRHRYGIHHHGAPYVPAQVAVVDGLPTLDIPRTVADLAREHGYVAGLIAADGAMQKGIGRDAMRAAARRMTSWPGVTVVRRVIADADPGAESAAETLGRLLVMELGRGRPRTQFPVPVPGGVRWVDMLLGRHCIEVDGRTKIIPVERGGVAEVAPESVLWREKVRERDVTTHGLGLSRLFYEDFWGERRVQTLRRLEAEVVATERRFGSELPAHLVEFAARLGPRRYKAS